MYAASQYGLLLMVTMLFVSQGVLSPNPFLKLYLASSPHKLLQATTYISRLLYSSIFPIKHQTTFTFP